ncbi:SpoIIE family protein phosphatase [Streptomyces cavernae]|uniref:SpoIIE family protein phosphatase n=1 Tax=Streptomyces cavernae TaxID=2259034 RepID=UPI000FEBCFB3|nr:SpoIIE family protein phosphatase [Streptomyces cavernae]
MQRVSARAGLPTTVRTSLPGTPLAPSAARRFLRAALADWTELGIEGLGGLLAADAVVVVSELVTNAVVHAGTDIELQCRLDEDELLVIEVCDHHPSRTVRDEAGPYDSAEYGRGLRLVAALADSWGITYRPGSKTVWARLPVGGAIALMDDVVDNVMSNVMDDVVDERTAYAAVPPTADADPRPGLPVDPRTGPPPADPRTGSPPADLRTGLPSADLRTGLPSADLRTGLPPTDLATGPYAGPHASPYADPHTAPCADPNTVPHAGAGTGTALAADGSLAPAPRRSTQDQDWHNRGALSFLAEASDLLAGQLDEDLVAALAGQLLVPRLADWCAVWLEDEVSGRAGWGAADRGIAVGPRLARVWHGSENRIEELRRALEKDPPRLPETARSGAVPVPWPGTAPGARDVQGTALAYRLIAGGRPLGTLVIGRAGLPRFPDEVTGLVEDFSRRVALAIGAARQYARQATISRVLQRGLLPGAVAEIPGVRSALVYEPCDKGGPSGDFYDLFPAGHGRWCFAVGDVQGKGPEAAVVIGLARPWLRLLAREGYHVADVLDRLNQLLLDDATEASDAAARALVRAGAGELAVPVDGPQTRFLSLLYGELEPFDGGVRCTLASAGHPLPLLMSPDGGVRAVAQPQVLLGVMEDPGYTCETFELRTGDSLLCVTDGVTERRCENRQFDDGDGLAAALAGCAGLDAELIAERIRRLVHEFGEQPPEDDLALLVLQAE